MDIYAKNLRTDLITFKVNVEMSEIVWYTIISLFPHLYFFVVIKIAFWGDPDFFSNSKFA